MTPVNKATTAQNRPANLSPENTHRGRMGIRSCSAVDPTLYLGIACAVLSVTTMAAIAYDCLSVNNPTYSRLSPGISSLITRAWTGLSFTTFAVLLIECRDILVKGRSGSTNPV